jgi:hypothetical protein
MDGSAVHRKEETMRGIYPLSNPPPDDFSWAMCLIYLLLFVLLCAAPILGAILHNLH